MRMAKTIFLALRRSEADDWGEMVGGDLWINVMQLISMVDGLGRGGFVL